MTTVRRPVSLLRSRRRSWWTILSVQSAEASRAGRILHGMPTRRTRRSRSRQLEASAVSAFGPVVMILPFCLLALLVLWLLVRLAWDVPYWVFAGGYCLGAVLLFVRPIQAFVLTPLFGARSPTAEEQDLIQPLWRQI